MVKQVLSFVIVTCCLHAVTHGQSADEQTARDAFLVKQIFETALRDGQCYQWLTDLAEHAGHRLSGSAGAEKAVNYTRHVLDTLGLDSVWLQACTVPRWVRGAKEQVWLTSSRGTVPLHAIALGNSVGSGAQGVAGNVIAVNSLDALREMPDRDIEGNIVYFNRAMDETIVNTFHAYGRAVDQRWSGPTLAASKGAIAAVVRSMTTALDTFPHTGSTQYLPDMRNIPAVAISTMDAEMLDEIMRHETVQLMIRTHCAMEDSVESYNVIGEIAGSTHPEEIILIGGHLDSWDVGHGAHDDGSGCMQSMDVLHLLRKIGYTPQRTIRCVLFMNEENGLSGAKTYARQADARGEFHLAAIESDAGGFRPLGFSLVADGVLQEAYLSAAQAWWGILEPYNLILSTGGGGADINPLRNQGGMLFGLRPDSQRYFDYHHTNADTVDKVHPRELKLGAAALTALVVMIDQHSERIQ